MDRRKSVFKKVGSLVVLFLLFLSIWGQIPSSHRSKNVIKRVKPKLEKMLAEKKIKFGSPVFIRIFKESMELEIWIKSENAYALFRTYPVCTYGFGSLGPKVKEGDGQAPEGFYSVYPGQLNPSSQFHLSFNIGYPNKYDRSHRRTGGTIMVHGNCVSIGCFAMTNTGIEEIYTLVQGSFENGLAYFPVHIFPFRMTDENMKKHEKSEWLDFWQNLKQGYDLFEETKIPPQIKVKNKKYLFSSK